MLELSGTISKNMSIEYSVYFVLGHALVWCYHIKQNGCHVFEDASKIYMIHMKCKGTSMKFEHEILRYNMNDCKSNF